MLRPTACKQLTHAAAILALALLCAQTLVVAHDHQSSDSELCAVCSTPAEQADSPSPAGAMVFRVEVSSVPASIAATPADGNPASQQARAPPIA
jgi:hypothetical protein